MQDTDGFEAEGSPITIRTDLSLDQSLASPMMIPITWSKDVDQTLR